MDVESICNRTDIHENQGNDAVFLAQTLSSACHPVFNFSRADNHVKDGFLGKRAIQRQKFAMHVNTRHMAPYHFETSVPYQSGISMQDATDQPLSIQQLKSSLDIAETTQPQLMAEDFKMEDASSMAVDASKQYGMDINASRKREKGIHTRKKASHSSIFLSKPKSCSLASTSMMPGPFSYNVPPTGTIASTAQVKLTHKCATRSKNQIHFMRKVQGWRDTLQCIYKSRRDSELFGDKPSTIPDLLKLLEEMDKQKYDVTHEVEQAASLVQEINWVKRYLDESTDRECIRLAERILRDFHQRFYGESN